MSEETKQHLKDSSTWKRILYMILFVFAYGVAEILLTAIVVAQLLFKLFTGNTNERLLGLGKQVSRYVYDVLLFLTFNSDEKPFPFSEWPNENKKLDAES